MHSCRIAFLLLSFSLFSASSVFASELGHSGNSVITFSYWNEATPPFVMEENGKITGGLIKDIGDALASKLNLAPHYVKLPVPRIEQYLLDGSIDADCITNRQWKKSPNEYHWSPALFDGADRLLIMKNSNLVIEKFEDLEGKRLGVYNGYVYHPVIMKMIADGKIETTKVNNVEKGMLLMSLDRLDALIDFGTLLSYQVATAALKDTLTLAPLLADEYQLSCAFSKKSPVSQSDFDQAVAELIDQGLVRKALDKYR